MNKLMSELIYILQLLWLCLRVVFHSTCKNILHRNTFQENLFRYWNNLICITVGISNGVAIPAKSSVTNKRAQFVVLESKKSFGFFFQKWRSRDFPKIEENKNHPKLLQIVYFGFIFHKWRSGEFPEFGYKQLWSRDIFSRDVTWLMSWWL